MGEKTTNSDKRPGILVVRPTLHEPTNENAATFKRWTIMHYRDLLNLAPPKSNTKAMSHTLRYTNSAGEIFHTIHADDIDVWNTPAYYAVSRRLDLENTRQVGVGEEAVLPASHDLGLGEEPMIWHLVSAEFGVFVEVVSDQHTRNGVESYQSFPSSLLSPSGAKPSAPSTLLVVLTFRSPQQDTDAGVKLNQVQDFGAEVAARLSDGYAESGKVYTSLYRHVPEAQPHQHPVIAAGEDGDGEWVACIMVEGRFDKSRVGTLETELEDLVDKKRSDSAVGWYVRVGVWSGDVFMG